MDYIYGKLNFEALKVDYKGKLTSTAKTTVDRSTNEISVDVLKLPDNAVIDGGE